MKLERGVQAGLLVLVALMPFHAFLSVWLGHLLGHEAIIQAWKEVLLLVLAVLAGAVVWRDPRRLARLNTPWVWLAAALAVLAGLVTLATHPPLTAVAFGAKTDFEFLLAAVIASLVASPIFIRRLSATILAGAVIVIAFGLAQISLLPADFLTHFGYSPNTIEPFEHIVQGVRALRFPSTLGGPNQLGTYLILPLCLSLAVAMRRRRRWWWLALTAGGLVVLVGTYSRSAWIGAAAALTATFFIEIPRHLRTRAAVALASLLLLALAALPFVASSSLRYFVFHSVPASERSSDSEHASSLSNGIAGDLKAPLGHGLGTAGPATFHAGTAKIIENYYLQLGYEAGILGALLFVLVTVAIITRLSALGLAPLMAVPTAATLVGISLASIVLPAWTDSSTALITWTAAGALAGLTRSSRHV
jgi:hypothetical protein